MRCLVTGAAGFVGSSIVDRLLGMGCNVVGVDCFVDYYPKEIKLRNIESALKNPKYKFIEADLNNLDMESLVSEKDWIFHQAAQAGVRASWGSYFSEYCSHNILATQKLLEAAKNTKVKKIVFASSSSVYGDAESYPTNEDMRPKPVSPYGMTKLASEHLMVLYASQFGVPTVSLRYFTVFGPRQRPDMAFNRFISAALQGKELTLYGDGEQSRDFSYISDIVDANIQSAEMGNPGDVFNIGGGTQATVNEVLSHIEKRLGALKIKREEKQKGDARHTRADTTRAQQVIKYNPKVSLYDGLDLEIEWLQGTLNRKS